MATASPHNEWQRRLSEIEDSTNQFNADEREGRPVRDQRLVLSAADQQERL